MAIEGIFFDAADVLYRRKEPTAAYAQRLVSGKGYPTALSAQDAERRQVLSQRAKRGQVSPEAYWDAVLLLYGVPAAAGRAVLVAQIIAQADEVDALPAARATVQTLKARGFFLGIITDTIYPIATKMRWLDTIGVAEFIDLVACSTELGVHKPDPEIYLAAVRQAKLTVESSAFVGHDTDELAGAQRVGLTTVAVFYDDDAQADYYAPSLPALLDVPILQAGTHERTGP